MQLLLTSGINASYIYSSLDQTARKINVAKFVNKKVMVMLVTDVAVSHPKLPFHLPVLPSLSPLNSSIISPHQLLCTCGYCGTGH